VHHDRRWKEIMLKFSYMCRSAWHLASSLVGSSHPVNEVHVIGSPPDPFLYLGQKCWGCLRCVYCMFVAQGDCVAIDSKIHTYQGSCKQR
jgi:hypothetical protein